MKTKPHATDTLPLRIAVVDPPHNILWALQIGRDRLVKPTSSTKSRICFDFEVEVVPNSAPAGFDLRGLAVQGRPRARFVYLCIGAYAGQVDSAAGWRAKIRLESITRKLLAAVKGKSSGVLMAEFAGTGPKGGPACATVPLLGTGWHVT